MAEQEKSKKFGGNFKRQSELTIARNKRAQSATAVPRGTARHARRLRADVRGAWLKSQGMAASA